MERITRDKLVKKVADNLQDKSINFSIPYHGRYQLKVKAARFLKEACERFNNKILSKEK